MEEDREISRLAGLRQSLMARVLLYYVLLAAAVFVLSRLIPETGPGSASGFESLVGGGPADVLGQLGFGAAQAPTDVSVLNSPALALYTAISVLGALALMIPVAWVFMITRGERGWNQSTVQTLIMLPIAVCGIVIIVQDSIALAFSLAGIVAVVRFRQTLKDTKDAVYIFIALGVGLAAGVQSLAVAVVMSVVFNIVVLLLWRANVGRPPPDLEELMAQRRRARALAGTAFGGGMLTPSDPDLLAAMTPEQLDIIADRARRLQANIQAVAEVEEQEELGTTLLVHASNLESAQRAVESVLQDRAKRWRLEQILSDDDGTSTLQFLVKLKKSTLPAALIDTLKKDGAPHIVGAELK